MSNIQMWILLKLTVDGCDVIQDNLLRVIDLLH